jgi:UV DNA damage endonuclease
MEDTKGEPMNKPGLCCISLSLKERGFNFKTMTYKRFSSLDKEEALEILGDRIHNNMVVTNETIKFCGDRGYTYRISSDLFPLITYDEADICLEDLPNYNEIQDEMDNIEQTIARTNVRISCHPSQFCVLASNNSEAVDKTITELNFYSSFMDRIGCPANYNSPMNIHLNNSDGDSKETIDKFYSNFLKLDTNCQKRLVLENEDKINCWSVKRLITHLHCVHNTPITFDYLHHQCHPDGLTEAEALELCYLSWGSYKPLFHYSESREGDNPRSHADYPKNKFNNYGYEFDIDFELKAKDKAIEQYIVNNDG